ncbi:hypothetical protein BaRGS_00015166 [Batillaria attramentaria]|uniref:Uncharacterized protein n=1 Tax=Batillaria attramentaria TaxID=370345 RepID=A0ABD0L2M7_9CAEN
MCVRKFVPSDRKQKHAKRAMSSVNQKNWGTRHESVGWAVPTLVVAAGQRRDDDLMIVHSLSASQLARQGRPVWSRTPSFATGLDLQQFRPCSLFDSEKQLYTAAEIAFAPHNVIMSCRMLSSAIFHLRGWVSGAIAWHFVRPD